MSRSVAGPAQSWRGVAGLAVVLLMAAIQWGGVRDGIWVDLDVYTMGARALGSDAGLYAVRSAEDLPFTYPPFAAGLFVVLTYLPTDAARIVFTATSVTCFVVSAVVVGRHLRLRRDQVLWLCLACFALEPVLRTILLGQINAILLLAVIVDVLFLGRFRGLLIGVATGIKLTPAVFVVLFLVQGDWRAAVRLGLSFLGTVAVGWAIAPAASREFWSGAVVELSRFGADATLGTDNQSLLAAVLRIASVPEISFPIQLSLLLVGVCAGAAVARRCLGARPERASAAAVAAATLAIAIGGLLGSPVSWSHHWTWMILALALLLYWRRRLLAWVVLIAFWFPSVWLTYTEADFGELLFPAWRIAASLVYVVAGLLLLALLATQHDPQVPRADRRDPQVPPNHVDTAPR